MEDLVKKAKGGDASAFSELILLVRTDLYRAAFSILRNDADSQDAVQETIIKIYYNLHKLRNDKNFKAWARRIVVNISKQMYKSNKSNVELADDDFPDADVIDASISDINFDHIFSELSERDQEIFRLHFVDGLTSRTIAKRLGMTHSNVRSRLSRGILKLRERHTPATLFIFILCMFIATGVIAVSIVSYIKGLFNLSDVGINNDGILMAIENLDWYQEVDMDYQDLGDGYKIKMDYLLMDEMNLYMIFDLESEKDLSKYTDVSLTDLRIVDESNNVICDKNDILAEQYAQRFGSKLIEHNSHNMKLLVYMYTAQFPLSKSLNISLSKIRFYENNKLDIKGTIDSNTNFIVYLSDKFVNRNIMEYTSNSTIITRAIVTETGFYAIVEYPNCDKYKISLKNSTNYYTCYAYSLSNYETLKYIIVANFENSYDDSLSLSISNDVFELVKLK